MLLPDTPVEGAYQFAERLRKAIAALQIPHDGKTLHVTISLGVSSLEETMLNHTQLIEATDKALYQSKENGRNCTSIAGND